MLAITAAPMLPPIVRMFAFMPLATPVCEVGTAATTSADIAGQQTGIQIPKTHSLVLAMRARVAAVPS